MTRDELLAKLVALRDHSSDEESGHFDADKALLEFINDPEITKAFRAIPKWYA